MKAKILLVLLLTASAGASQEPGFKVSRFQSFKEAQVGTSAQATSEAATSAPAADLPGTPVADPKAVLAKARAAAGMITAEDAEAAPRAQRKSGQQELLAASSQLLARAALGLRL